MSAERKQRFERLFRKYGASVRGYARRRVDDDLADEVVSDVFVVLWRRLDEVPDEALPWLLGCARKVIANHRRGRRRRQALSERLRQTYPADVTPAVEPGGELSRALATLGEGDREVLMLIAWEELSSADAARVLGCGERAFAMRLHRARRRLAARLDNRPVAHASARSNSDG